MPLRRFFGDEEKLAIVRETTRPGAKVAAVVRKHGIVTGLLFRRGAPVANRALGQRADDNRTARILRPPRNSQI
jgi:transposase-like protein